MVNRRRIVLLPALLAAGYPSHAQVRDINDAINKAGRQRMLSQRMAKSYLALGQSVRASQAEAVLAESMALFDRQLAELKAFAPSAQIKATYEQLESGWSAYKGALVGAPPSKAGAETVISTATRVLQLANQGTVQLEATSGRPAGRLVNLSGRQRMLSQRMAAMYLGATWGVQQAESLAAMNQARDEFTKAHAELFSAPETNTSIRSELELVQQQYGFFDAALRVFSDARSTPPATALPNVFATSELILKLMDGVTGMYARIT
jgi:hypothetical protein